MDWFNAVDATYRTDLRELNELNFARFDAKLEQRVVQLDAKLGQRLAELKAEMDARFAAADAKLEQRTAQLDRSIGEVRNEIAASRSEVIKWMFVFVGTAVLAILGLG